MRPWVGYSALGLALCLAIFSPASAGAADWSVVPSLGVGGAYTNNLNYAVTNKISDFTFNETPGVAFNYVNDIGSLTGTASVTELQYIKNTQDDNLDQNYLINGRYQLFPRLGLTMQTGYTVNSTLQQALSTTGVITSHIPQRYITVNPGISYSLTERLTATMSYGFNTQTSSDPTFINSTSHTGTLTLSYPLNNQKTTIGGTVTGNQSDYSNNDTSSQMGIYLNATQQFSEVWSANFSGGIDYTSSNNTSVVTSPVSPFFSLSPQTGRQSNVSPHINASLSRNWTNSTLTLAFNRTQPASGLGAPVSYNSASVSLSHNFTARLSGSVIGSYSESEPINASGSFATSVYNLGAQLSYLLTENLSLVPGCSAGLLQEQGKSANNLGATLMLTYSYPFIHYQK